MSRLGQALLKTLALTVALLFLFGAVVTGAWTYLFGTKVGPLFGMSADALAGASAAAGAGAGATHGGSRTAATDAGAAGADAGAAGAADAGPAGAEAVIDPPRPERRYFDASKSGLLREERTYQPASKSLGGLGLPGAAQADPGAGLGGLGTRRPPPADAGQ